MSRRATSLFLIGLVLAACGSPTVENTQLGFSGVFAGEDGTEAGNFSLTLVVENQSGTGAFFVNGDRIPFTLISYNPGSGAFTGVASGYTFTGQVDGLNIEGTYESPTGGGLWTGMRRTSGSSVVTYCGSHIGTHIGEPIAGPFVFVDGGGERRGVFTSVLGDPFRGEISSSSAAGPVTLGTLTGDASLAVTSSAFTGTYAMDAGDTGSVQGARCRSTVTSPILSLMDGVAGSFDGLELGAFSLSLSSTGIGGSGSYRLGGVARNFLTVVSGVENKVAAFDSTYRIIAVLTGQTMSGSYSSGGAVTGLAAALQRQGNTPSAAYCGVNSVGGAFVFVARPDSILFGAYTGGTSASAFQGNVDGRVGDNLSTMETLTGPVTVLTSAVNFSGFWDHTASGGTSGGFQGPVCP